MKYNIKDILIEAILIGATIAFFAMVCKGQQPLQAPTIYIPPQAPEVVDTQWLEYLQMMETAKKHQYPVVIFVGFDGSDKYGELSNFCRYSMDRFPEVEDKAIVVAKYNKNGYYERIDLPHDSTTFEIKSAAGIIKTAIGNVPLQFYSPIQSPNYIGTTFSSFRNSSFGTNC